MKILLTLIVSIMFIGCATTSTSVQWYDGNNITIKSSSDARVVYTKGNETVEVDNRGRPGFIEQVFGAILLKSEDLKQ